MNPIAQGLVEAYRRLSEALASGDAQLASAEVRSGNLAPDSPPVLLESLATMFPVLGTHDVAHAERIDDWACLFLRTTSPGSRRESFRVLSFREEEGRWRAETGASEPWYDLMGDEQADAASFAAMLEDHPWDRPKPKAPRSASYVPPADRPKQDRPACEAPEFLEALRLPDSFQASSAAAVDELERSLGCEMPACYREFVGQYGAAVYAGWVRVYPPQRISAKLQQWRDRVREYYFWSAGADLLDHDSLVQCIVVADTFDGDELVFHAADPAVLYVLPRHDERIHVAGNCLDAALRWLATSGTLTAPIDVKYVEPLRERTGLRAVPGAMTSAGFAELSSDLVGLGLHDARSDSEDEDGASLQLFCRALGGIITILDVGPPGPPDIHVTFDPDAESTASSRVRALLERHDYTVDNLD